LSRWIIVLALAVLAGVSLTACESSQDKARKLQEQAVQNAPKPLKISRPDKDVKVLDTTLLHDQYGDAIVVDVKNESNQTLVNVPILVDLRDSKGKSLYENNTAGSATALNHIPLLKPGVFVHIHDIFVSFQYPREWVFEGRQWTEDYLLRAFLMYNTCFRIKAFNTFLAAFHEEWFKREMPLCLRNSGGSIWLQRTG